MGLFAFVLVEFAIVFDVAFLALICHRRAMGDWGKEGGCQGANIM